MVQGRGDGRWEELFIVKPSLVLVSLGVDSVHGLFAARRFRNLHTLMHYTGKDLGEVGTEKGIAAMDHARRYSKSGRYIMRVKGTLQNYKTHNEADYEPARLYSIYKVHTELRADLWGTYFRKRAV